MNISVIGTGYVGLVTGVGLANSGNDVICMDISAEKIKILEAGQSPIYEPGLDSLIEKNIREKRLSFTTSIKDAIAASDIIFIAVGTPPQEDGSADLQYVKAVAASIGEHMQTYKVIVNKSTVPVGTMKNVNKLIQDALDKRSSKLEFDVVSNPEFLREGAAVEDFLKPDRIIIGSDSERATKILFKLYRPFVENPEKILIMDPLSSEMSKYAANAMLATKISFMNEIAVLCEKTGADITKVRNGIGSDPRIGYQFINAGIGYGGSCFPKDVKALIQIAKEKSYQSEILRAVDLVNDKQRLHFLDKILTHFQGNLRGKTFAAWGLAFKPETDDMREAPAIDVIKALLKAGAAVTAFDPKATHEAAKVFGDTITYQKDDMYAVLKNADALIIFTEWKEFYSPNFTRMKESLKNPLIFDGRNIFTLEEMKEQGFLYYSIGRSNVC